jgi:hypothetical protein
MKYYILILLFLTSDICFSQWIVEWDTTIAPEVWSKPVKLPEIVNGPEGWAVYPFLCRDNKTLYFSKGRSTLYYTIMNDTGWTKPTPVSSKINCRLIRQSSLTSDMKKIFYVGNINWGWYVFSSTWSDSLNDWNEPERLSDSVNYGGQVSMAYISEDGKTLYYCSDNYYEDGVCYGQCNIFISKWDDTLKTWRRGKNLGPNINYCNDPSYYNNVTCGTAMPAGEKKIYYSKWIGEPYNYELYVSYKDSNGNWGKGMRLNINSVSDTTEDYPGWKRTDIGGWDYYPAISTDGKTLIYTSRRTWKTDEYESLWISRLLVDEKGNIVTKVNDLPKGKNDSFRLSQNYPNPFNPNTKITYHLEKRSSIELTVYDALGKEIKKIENTTKNPGSYTITWNGKDSNGLRVSSGIYFYTLKVNNNTSTKKMILLR